MSAALSVRLESTSSLIDVLIVRDPEFHHVDISVRQSHEHSFVKKTKELRLVSGARKHPYQELYIEAV